ncbi:uncharacterized protein LOC111697135 [Eurytemora carolleeae]|uniref:uncharacterized protein LOC111697135 n=1 Tax=Eurytemora carolleeae TaxID=1294199 RepID=UPI000C77CFB3|nr:uncharacterized protein LOC111697135 [Eurytemora carolleeae]|eukprot:XP_023322799.1 uncharacterized protein LOC111697135 [Eurytemora affinis]
MRKISSFFLSEKGKNSVDVTPFLFFIYHRMSDVCTIFAKDPVWVQTTRSGFRQQLFVMYHSTREVENVARILDEGFNLSGSDKVLGNGLYVSRDLNKSAPYGPVTFKLLVYPGKTKTIQRSDDPLKTSWHKEFSAAWIPPHNSVTPAGLEETCVKSAAQVRILGVVRGWEYLEPYTKGRLKNDAGTSDRLDLQDNKVLEDMIEQLGIVYSSLVNLDQNKFLEARGGQVYLTEWNGSAEQQWSRTWDNCLEQKASGLVLTLDGGSLILDEVNPQTDSRQKWRLDGKGRFVHKSSNMVLTGNIPLDPAGTFVSLKLDRLQALQGCDKWRFRCLFEIREKDDFVEYTPWQSLLSWT